MKPNDIRQLIFFENQAISVERMPCKMAFAILFAENSAGKIFPPTAIIIESGFEIIQTKGGAIIVPTVAEAVEVSDVRGVGDLCTRCVKDLMIAPSNTS